MTFFKRSVHELIRSSHQIRATHRKRVIDRLRASRDFTAFANELLEQCVTRGGPEGLEIGIDILSRFGGRVFNYMQEFLRRDEDRWSQVVSPPRHNMNDDVWYILLRALATSGLDPLQTLPMLSHCAVEGTASVREASIRALGDFGGSVAIGIVRRRELVDGSPMVRETAAEVLDDLEG